MLLPILINIFWLFFIAGLRLRMIPRNLKLHVSEAKYTQAGKNRRQRQYMYKKKLGNITFTSSIQTEKKKRYCAVNCSNLSENNIDQNLDEFS